MKRRYLLLDNIRGLLLINMILYHALWDIVYIYGVDMPWYKGNGAHIWQQCICWSFILLSGFCWSFGRNNLKRGLLVSACSVVISLVTLIFMPESKILFGVLSLIGTSMLIMIPLDKPAKRINPFVGLAISFILFLFTKEINEGSLGFFGRELIKLPEGLYANMFTAYLGFPNKDFFSTDYFSVLPWFLLYLTGYFLNRIFIRYKLLEKIPDVSFMPLQWLGKNSLVVYMLHQPIVYGILWAWFSIIC